jgi:hypothetical protein
MENLETNSKEERRRTQQQHAKVWGGLLGAAAGAGMGGIAAGPPGFIAGLCAGSAMGAATAWAAFGGASDAADRDSQLDIDIGVHGPDLGAPNLKHPPVEIGAFSREASGAGSVNEDEVQADGPIQPPPA